MALPTSINGHPKKQERKKAFPIFFCFINTQLRNFFSLAELIASMHISLMNMDIQLIEMDIVLRVRMLRIH